MAPRIQKEMLVYLSLGSNLGDKLQNLKSAMELINSRLGEIHSASCTYESDAWGYASDNSYFNNCISVFTQLSPYELLEGINIIEAIMGRVREGTGYSESRRYSESKGYSDRIIDIDLLFYGNEVIDDPGLKVPHPRLGGRMFVLVPLMEIAPDLTHPETHLTVGEMIDRCNDRGRVSRV